MIKLFCATAILVGTASAQLVEGNDAIYNGMSQLTTMHTESVQVKEITTKIELDYNVSCAGNSSTIFPDITKKVTYKAECSGNAPIELKIISKFKSGKDGLSFEVKEYNVKFL